MRDEEYFAIKERAAAQLLKLPHVNAVGIGGREKNGQPTGEVVIKVFVTHKKPFHEVPPEEVIPESFEGVATDVIEMGPPSKIQTPGAINPEVMPLDGVTFDPLRGGISITPEGAEAIGGTLGCLLRDKKDVTAVYGLTNHHVVVNPNLSLSRRLSHPLVAVTGFSATNTIGIVAAGFDESKGDAAVIRLNPNQRWTPTIEGIGSVRGTHQVTLAEAKSLNYQVRKRGIRTGLTGGIVEAIGTTSGSGSTKKTNDMIIRPNPDPTQPGVPTFFVWDGDSGSVIVNAADEVVGLIYAKDRPKFEALQTHGLAAPIKDVLKRFKARDALDLEVVIDTGITSTVLVPAGAPTMTGQDILDKGDHRYYRPLTGGSQIMAEPMLGAVNSTTLGCIVTELGHPTTAYVLTSFSGVSAHGTLPPTTETDVGQPDNSHSLSGCCSNTFGEFFRGGPDVAAPTAAIIKLEEDQRWLAEIIQIGLVAGAADVTALDVSSGTYQVRKRGPETRLTGGVVTALGGVHGTLPAGVRSEAMIIRPNDNPSRPGEAIHFSQSVDRGAVVVNADNHVVGLLYDEVLIPDVNGNQLFHGVATPIRLVLDQLKTALGVQLEVAIAAGIDQVQTTSNRVMTPEGSIVSGRVARRGRRTVLQIDAADMEPSDAVGRLEELLAQSGVGRMVIALWNEHNDEVRYLINHNRRVATVWHRSGGPALLQALVRTFHSPSLTVPTTLSGQPTSACVDRLSRIFCKYGSPRLQTDVANIRPLLPSLGGLSFTEILDAFSRS